MEKKSFKGIFARAVICGGSVLALCLGSPAMASESADASTVTPTAAPTLTATPTPTAAPTATPTPTATAAPTATPTPTPTATPTPKPKTKTVKNGWVTDKKGRKRYYKKGKYLTGRHKINGKYYYFSPKGYMKKSAWIAIKNKKYYFGRKGVGYTGLKRIDKKWYYFAANGVLKTQTTTTGKITYYINDSGNVEAYQEGSNYYYPSGKQMDSTSAANFETLQYAKTILAEITTDSMSDSQKLLTCFNWVIKHGYRTTHVYTKQQNWHTLFANDYLKDRTTAGSCFSDSCAFAFLAKAIGYENVKICVDTTGTANAHCFAMIGDLCYDPLFAEAKSFSSNYAARLGVYALYPMYSVTI